MTDVADPDVSSLRAEHDEVSALLHARRSIVHFAHAAISTFIGLIVAGTAAKLFWDFGPDENLGWTLGLAGVAGALLLYAAIRSLAGRRALAVEMTWLERLHALRRALKLDDPRTLLPS